MIKIHVVDSLPLAPSYYGREGYRIVDTQVKVEELIQFNPLLKTKIAITINTEKAQSSLLKLAEENDNPLLEITFITDSIEKVSEALYSRAVGHSVYVPIYGEVLETFKDKYPTTTYEFIKKHELEYITALEELSESDFETLLQLAEIFSSFEYLDAKIYILLIDEPDSHLHVKLQKKLIEEFRGITNSQLFIITHNERILNEARGIWYK